MKGVMRVEAREYLEQIEKFETIIANKEIEKRYWLDMATGISVKMDGERVQTSGDNHSMENQVVEAVLIDEEIARLKAEIASIIRTLERLKTSDYDFLHKIYIQRMTLKEIQGGKSYSWATSKHSRALKRLQEILDEKKERL